jgi:predicted dehydrogenase
MSAARLRRHLLVLGAGSVGKRHLRNFSQLGCDVSAFDQRADRVAEAGKDVKLIHGFVDIRHAWDASDAFDGVVIASPTAFHVEQAAAAIKLGKPVFLEKPMASTAVSASSLRDLVASSGVPLLLGYTYRWWPALREVNRLAREGHVGRVLHVQCTMSAHLADWHPWERYQDFFMASKALGGGALLDESHFVDLMIWMFGLPTEVFASVDKLSALEIETDDTVDVVLFHTEGPRIQLHLDLFGRPHERSITIRGDAGTIKWDYESNCVRVSSLAGGPWESTAFHNDRNEMFLSAAGEFVSVVNGQSQPSCTAEDGYSVMRVLDAMRVSSAEKRAVLVAGDSGS